jgi:hypothetical protein
MTVIPIAGSICLVQITSSNWRNPLEVGSSATLGSIKSNLVTDGNGNIFVIDAPASAAGTGYIRQISAAGGIITTLSTSIGIACGASACTSLAMDSNANFYFSTDLSTITAVSSSGSVTVSSAIPNLWFYSGSGAGPGIVSDSSNNIYFTTSDVAPSIVVHRAGNPAFRSVVFSLPANSADRFFL